MKDSKQKKITPLEDLTLMNRFLFSEAVEDQQFFEDLLSIIIGDDVLLKGPPQAEKEVRTGRELRKYVRLDVWAEDDQDDIYNAEVQGKDTKNLPKRGRYYQALIDSKLLDVGETDYNKLNRIHMITIAPFDLFGLGKYKYTFQMQCIEEPNLLLGDDAYRIYLNTKGKDAEHISPELKALLEFLENPTEEVAERSESQRIKRMQKHVKSLKSNAEVGVRYMNAWEEIEYAKQEGLAEGREKGLAEGREKGEKSMQLTIAKNMLRKGEEVNCIAEYTGLTEEEIAALAEEA